MFVSNVRQFSDHLFFCSGVSCVFTCGNLCSHHNLIFLRLMLSITKSPDLILGFALQRVPTPPRKSWIFSPKICRPWKVLEIKV